MDAFLLDKMAKLSYDDKLRIQTLREQGLGARKIKAAYPEKNWSLSTLIKICQRVDRRGSAVARQSGSGRPRSARTAQNIAQVEELICSQDGQPGTSKSTRDIAGHLGICHKSVANIAKQDLGLKCFRRVPAQVLTSSIKHKRLSRCRRLLHRLPVNKLKKVFFTDEKVFYLNPPVSSQYGRVWGAGRKRDLPVERLVRQRAKFSVQCMVSAGVCYSGKGHLHFVPEKAKVNTECYMTQLLPGLLQDCNELLGEDFTFQQDGAPAHSAQRTQEFLQLNCPDFINKSDWPPNSPDLNPLDFHIWGVMLDKYHKHQPKPQNIKELKSVLQEIWESLPLEQIQRSILSVRKRLSACVRAKGGHFEHLLP